MNVLWTDMQHKKHFLVILCAGIYEPKKGWGQAIGNTYLPLLRALSEKLSAAV